MQQSSTTNHSQTRRLKCPTATHLVRLVLVGDVLAVCFEAQHLEARIEKEHRQPAEASNISQQKRRLPLRLLEQAASGWE